MLEWFSIDPNSVLAYGFYSKPLVAFSVLMAIFSSYVGIQIASYAEKHTAKRRKNISITAGSLALGGGIWSMHFLGMLAFDLCTPVDYNWPLTLVSIMPSIFASWVALNHLVHNHSRLKPLLLSGTLMGAGIGVMHYTGMAAMEMAPLLRYDLTIFSLSIVIAVALAIMSLWLRFYLANNWQQPKTLWLVNVFAAIVMGCAISGMHYVGMAAARFVLPPGLEWSGQPVGISYILAGTVTGVTLILIVAVLGGVVLNTYRDITERARASQKRLGAIMDSAIDSIVTIDRDGIIVSANKSTQLLLGWSIDELVGNNVKMIVPAPHFANHDKYIKDYLETGRAKIIGVGREVHAQHKNGHLIDVRLGISHVSLPHDHYFVAFISDIRQRLQMENALRENEAKFRSLVANIPGVAYRCLDQKNWPLIFISDACVQMFGSPADAFLASPQRKTLQDMIHPDDLEYVNASRRESDTNVLQYRMQKHNGDIIWVLEQFNRIEQDGQVAQLDGFIMDITDKVRFEEQIARYKSLVDSSEDAIVSKSLDNIVQTWNHAAERLFGYSASEIIGHTVDILIPEDRRDEELKLTTGVRDGEPTRHYRSVRRRKNGSLVYVSLSVSPIYDQHLKISGVSIIARDISKEIEQEETIKRQVNYDHLTGLMSRIGFTDTAQERIEIAKLKNTQLAILFIDLDNFKLYNDSYGHEFGDHLLITIASALKTTVRRSDDVGRLGGDEFVICLPDAQNEAAVKHIAAKVVDAVSGITEIDDTRVTITASVGVSMFPSDGDDLTTLLQCADHAMYGAKNKGKNQVRFFSGGSGEDMPDNYQLIEDLGIAIATDQLELYFQPIIDPSTRQVYKAEALVRWHHPKLGMVSPGTFVPLAEKYGLAKLLGDWVTNRAMECLKEWTARFRPDFQVGINKSAYEFYDHDECVANLSRALAKNGLSGENLIIEITEHSLMEHSKVTERILNSYRELGVRIALDDFGTGYSSLAYLKRYPVDFIKIDRSFVATLEYDTVDYHLCDSIVQIAQKLGLKVVAEGIETPHQADLLLGLGVNLLQGFMYSKPLPVEEFEQFVMQANKEDSVK